MPKFVFIHVVVLVFIAVSGGSLSGQPRLRDQLREKIAERRGKAESPGNEPTGAGKEELSYGTHELQKLDFWKSKPLDPAAQTPGSAGAPLVIYVHGGGWKRGDKGSATGEKDAHYLGQGYAFASLNYRLVPDHTVEEQAQDVVDALAFLLLRAGTLGFDARRVALMGHSAGAHLVALVGTDPAYLKKAGLTEKSLRGVIPIDGAAYHVADQITGSGQLMHDTYLQAFGTDPVRQGTLSPTLQAAAPNAPAFLILHVQRQDAITQSKALAAALREGGSAVEIRDFEGTGLQGHSEINRRLGDPTYAATPVVDAWLKNIFDQALPAR